MLLGNLTIIKVVKLKDPKLKGLNKFEIQKFSCFANSPTLTMTGFRSLRFGKFKFGTKCQMLGNINPKYRLLITFSARFLLVICLIFIETLMHWLSWYIYIKRVFDSCV